MTLQHFKCGTVREQVLSLKVSYWSTRDIKDCSMSSLTDFFVELGSPAVGEGLLTGKVKFLLRFFIISMPKTANFFYLCLMNRWNWKETPNAILWRSLSVETSTHEWWLGRISWMHCSVLCSYAIVAESAFGSTNKTLCFSSFVVENGLNDLRRCRWTSCCCQNKFW